MSKRERSEERYYAAWNEWREVATEAAEAEAQRLLAWKAEAEASGAMRYARRKLIDEALKGLEVLP